MTFDKKIKQASCVKVPNLMALCKLNLGYLGQKFEFRKLSTLLAGSFLIGLTFLGQVSTFPEIWIIIGSVEIKSKIFRKCCSKYFGTLQSVSTGPDGQSTTNKTKHNILYNKFVIRVATGVVKRLKT